MSRRVVVYPGTFDPITNGHLDIIERGVKLFDHLIIAVAENPKKTPLFTVEERVEMIMEVSDGRDNVEVETFDNLLVDYARKKNVCAILRGLRVVSDFEYEFQMALTNRKLDRDIETIFLMTAEHYSYISSRFIKEIARLGGKVECFVPENVVTRLQDKFKG